MKGGSGRLDLTGRRYVFRNLRIWLRNPDRRTDLWRIPDAHAGALDCGGRDRTLRSRDSFRGKSDPATRSRGIADRRSGWGLRFQDVSKSSVGSISVQMTEKVGHN